MTKEFKEINLNDIIVEHNTRKTFKAQTLNELADSIRQNGVLEPVLVRLIGDKQFSLIAGERRVRASFLAGRVTIPAIVHDITEKEALKINLIENLQRDNLPYMETALGVKDLQLNSDLSIEEISKKLNKSVSTVNNYLTLTKVPDEVKTVFLNEEVTVEVAVLISRLKEPSQQIEASRALKRTHKAKRVSGQTARAFVQKTFGIGGVIEKKQKPIKNGLRGNLSYYLRDWKKYFLMFSPEQFAKWKHIVDGRKDTDVWAEAVEAICLAENSRKQAA